jgi:hypothetical protein
VGIKQVLVREARPDTASLLDFLLSSPREYPTAVVNLFHKVSKAVTGRSLHDEKPELFKSLETLCRNRNRIAHHGTLSEPIADIARGVVDAGAVLDWLATFGD